MSANNFFSMQKRLLFKTDYGGKILPWGRESGGVGWVGGGGSKGEIGSGSSSSTTVI